MGQGQALHLWAPRAVLEARSPFFADLQDVYVMGVAQTQDGEAFPRPTDLDKSDGDDLSDEVVRSQFAKTGKLEPLDLGLIKAFQPGLVQVIVTNFRYTTWKAVISWLLTGEIHFAPLDCQTSKSLVREGCDFIPPSPRSVYRLAATLSLPELQKMALQYILEGYKSPDQLRDLENEFVGAMLQEHKEVSVSSRSSMNHAS